MKGPLGAAAAAKVAKRLGAWFGQTGKRGLGLRTQIIDPRLCTDVLKRLGASLEQHKGCDLIDINPGIGLWSEHLHDYLKPRRHILIDPDRDFFDPYLQRLVAKDPERITWADKSLREVIHDATILGENEAPRDERQRMLTVNYKVLLNINLAGPFRDSGKIIGRQDQYLWNNIYASFLGLRDDLWHRGLFKILAWVTDEQVYTIVPRAAEDISRQSLEFELAAQVSQVAGARALSNPHAILTRRIFDVEREDRNLLADADPEKLLADTRSDLPPLPPVIHLFPEVETFKSTESNKRFAWQDRLIELDGHVKKSDPGLYRKLAPAWKTLDRRKAEAVPSDPLVKEWLQLYGRARTNHSSYLACMKIVHDQRALEKDWRATPDDSDPSIPSLTQRANEITAAINKLRTRDQVMCRKAIDDYRLLDNRSTHWYRRTADPLIVHPREFAHENSPLALVDIQPNPEFRNKFDTDLKLRCLDFILPRLLNKPTQDIASSIEQNLLSGGIDQFLEMLPNLKDVRQGGWYDLKQLRVRTLPVPMWEEIALAYAAWPFRLSFEAMSFGYHSRNLISPSQLT